MTIDGIKDILNPDIDTTPRGQALRMADWLAGNPMLQGHEIAVLATFRANVDSGSIGPIRALKTLHRVDAILAERATVARRLILNNGEDQ